jgi:hypothetical protein
MLEAQNTIHPSVLARRFARWSTACVAAERWSTACVAAERKS